MQKKMTTDLTKGSVAAQLMRFAMPLFISNALQAVYNLVDMVVVGQCIGAEGMSAVSIGGDTLHLLTFVAMGFSSAGQVLIAQNVGAKDEDKVKHIIGTMFTLLLGVSIAISLICFILRNNILSWLNTPDSVRAYTMDYMVTCVYGLLFIYGYNCVSAILRGMGDSKRPFVFIAIAAVLNIILDVLFVQYMNLEVFGAALATVIGQGASFIISIIYLYVKRDSFGFDFKPNSFIPDKECTGKLLALGIPMSIQSAAVSFSKIVLTAWINAAEVATGIAYSALGGLYNKINMMAGIVSNSFTTAGASMIGQNLGAKKYERIPRILGIILLIGLAMSAAAAGALIAWPNAIFELFTDDSRVLLNASILILPTVLNFFGSATRSAAFAIINGSGRTKLNLAVALIDGIISRMGIAALMGFVLNMGCLGFWMGDTLAGFVPFIIGGSFFLSGRWKFDKNMK